MKWYFESSIFLRQFRNLKMIYSILEEKTSSMYLDSLTHRLIKKVNETIKICFRYSFLGKITQIRETKPALLDDSWVVQYLIHLYKRWKYKITHYLGNSSAANLVKDAKEELYFSSVRMLSLIIIITILINAILSVILQKQMDLWSFFMRILLLFAGTAGLSCEADWLTVKENSVFLRKLQRD